MLKKKTTSGDFHHSGFTMIELMVTIAILTILATVAIPEMSALLKNTKLKTATRHLVSTLQEMKLRAIKENAVTVLIIDVPKDEYIAFVDNNPENGVYDDSDEQIISKVKLKNDKLQITSNNTSIRFASRGLLVKGVGNCTITISNTSGSQKLVTINNAGRIRAE